MKKVMFTLLLLAAIFSAKAQTIVVQRPGLLTDLSTALIGIPVSAATGLVTGTIEAAGAVINGSTVVYQTTPPLTPVVVPQPRNIPPPAPTIVVPAPAPRVVAPAPVVVAPAPVVPSTTIVTTYADGTVTTYTREASAYEYGRPVAPVAPHHRVGPDPRVNPYVFRFQP
jgi:hypothetical protein